jgi:hypothetical protein
MAAAFIAQKSLLAESVFLGPKYDDKHGDKEVTDLLLVHRETALITEIKCQDDPDSRWHDLTSWTAKAAQKPVSQLRGSIRTLRERDYWCDHPVFGRVSFSKGQLQPIHGIVLIEHRVPGLSLPVQVPLELRDVPVSYLTVSDFLILIAQLRTFTEIQTYLKARHDISGLDPRLTGREEELLGHYMLHNGEFPTGLGQEQRLTEIHYRRSDFERHVLQKRLGDEECEEAEAAARALRRRAAGYPPRRADDQNYRQMQLALMDLSYADRRLVGRKIKQAQAEVSSRPSSKPEARAYSSAHAVITNANLAIIIVATRGAGPKTALSGLDHFLRLFISYIGNRNVLWINFRENSPKYQFVYIGAESLSGIEPLTSAVPRGIPPSAVTYSPEARF